MPPLLRNSLHDTLYDRFVKEQVPVRVLYVQPSGEPASGADSEGSSTTRVAALLSRLADWGLEIVALTGPDRAFDDRLRAEGLPDGVLLPAAFGTAGTGWQRLRVVADGVKGAAENGQEIDRLIHERAIDVVVAATPWAWLAAAQPTRRHDVPLIWWAEAPVTGLVERSFLKAWVGRQKPDLFLCADETVRASFEPLLALPAEVIGDVGAVRSARRMARLIHTLVAWSGPRLKPLPTDGARSRLERVT